MSRVFSRGLTSEHTHVWSPVGISNNLIWASECLPKPFARLDERLHPKAPDPVQVDGKFVPERFSPGLCAWVREVQLYEYEEKNYTYYPHPKSDARCFRITSDGRNPVKEYLMVQPGAVRSSDA